MKTRAIQTQFALFQIITRQKQTKENQKSQSHKQSQYSDMGSTTQSILYRLLSAEQVAKSIRNIRRLSLFTSTGLFKSTTEDFEWSKRSEWEVLIRATKKHNITLKLHSPPANQALSCCQQNSLISSITFCNFYHFMHELSLSLTVQ